MIFSGMLAGQMLSRHAGWGDLPNVPFSYIASSIRQQLAKQIGQAYNFYAAKVFNLTSNSAALDPRSDNPSSVWPFYLEAYTGAAAIQAGYVDDGLEIIRQVGLVNQRLGLQWAQNLWSPGFNTYVTAPATWFALDVLAATSLDQGAKTLMLAPVLRPNDGVAVYPIYFPSFWADVVVNRATKTIELTITKTFYGQVNRGLSVVLEKVLAQPVGKPTSSGATITLAQPFTCETLAVLDLSPSWDLLVDTAGILPRILPTAPPQ